jgi:hypothetical protein
MWRSNWSGSTRTRQVPPSQTWSVTDGCLDSYLNLNTTISGCHPTLTCFHTNTRRLWHLTLPPPHIHPSHSQHHRMDTSQKRKGYYIRFIQQHIFHASDFTNTYFLCVPCQQHRLMMISCSYAQQASPFTRLSYYQSTDSGKVHRLRPASSPSNRRQIASCCSMELLEMQFPAHWSHHTSC